jgi:hypothetical protein
MTKAGKAQEGFSGFQGFKSCRGRVLDSDPELPMAVFLQRKVTLSGELNDRTGYQLFF